MPNVIESLANSVLGRVKLARLLAPVTAIFVETDQHKQSRFDSLKLPSGQALLERTNQR